MFLRHGPARNTAAVRTALFALAVAPAFGSPPQTMSAAALAFGSPVQTTYHVATCGDDGWTGLSSSCTAPDGPKATIQAAIDASIDGDTILLADGTYVGAGNADLDFGGRLITLRSASGDPSQCIIEPAFGSRGFVFQNNETAEAVVQGLTVTNATAFGLGGAVLIDGCSPTVVNCVFDGNSASSITGGRGGGVSVQNGSPTILNCIFRDNRCGNPKVGPFGGGGGLYLAGSSAEVIHCVFVGNRAFAAVSQQAVGGGIYVASGAPNVAHCVFLSNAADDFGGAVENSGDLVITNSIFRGNTPDQLSSTAGLFVAYCNVDGGWPGPGNIDADPLFVDRDNGDLRLRAESPCIDAGHNWGTPQDTLDLDMDGITGELIPFDLDGAPRFSADAFDFDPGCGLPVVVDMGAHEYLFGPAEQVIFGDIDGDGTVGRADVARLLVDRGVCRGCCLSDLNIDGIVDDVDLMTLLAILE